MSARGPTPKQREAIESWQRGEVCVVAGPGSGKTYVLVERFRWLVEQKRVPVHRILAITFTEKAASNMRRRLVAAFPAESAERKAIERGYISTIHGFCARLLRENAIEAAVDPEFRVLDEWEADFELRRAIDQVLEEEYRSRPDRVRDFLERFGGDDTHAGLFELYHALRAAGVSPEEAGVIGPQPSAQQRWRALAEALDQVAALPTYGWNPKQKRAIEDVLELRAQVTALSDQAPSIEHFRLLGELGFDLRAFKRGSPQGAALKAIREELAPACRAALLLEYHADARAWLLEMLVHAGEHYNRVKRHAGALDYSDLEEAAIRLLQQSAGRIAAGFSFVLMDEFQDTNPLQAQLVGLLRSEGSFFAVGDINQSIYGFRHADPQVFRDYRQQTRDRGGHVVDLLENFRSRTEVLRAVTTIVKDAEGIEPQELKAEREFHTPPPWGLEILGVQAEDRDEALKLEARHVANRIQELCGALDLEKPPARYGDFAVLLRTTADVRVFERVLRSRGVPCAVTEGRGFYETREIADLVAFLRALLDPLDEISLAAVLRSPLAGASDDALLRLKLEAGTLVDGVARAAEMPGLDAADREKLQRFHALFDRYRRERDVASIDRLLTRLLAESGYEAWLLGQTGGMQMAANVRKLLAVARRFHAAGLAGVEEFVERVEMLRRDEAREAEADPPEQTEDAVRLMTVHAAKGLEFPVVFLSAINRGVRQDRDPVSFFPGIGVGVRWRDPATREPEPDAVAQAVAAEIKAGQRDETQRLLYVGMTRAEELLVLTASFGANSRTEQWAATVSRNLGFDWLEIDNQVRIEERAGLRFRLLRTNQEVLPLFAPAAPAAAVSGPEAVVWFDRAEAEEQSDAEVSASAVTLFALCPRRYYLSRYLRFDAPARERSPDANQPDGDVPADRDEMDATEFGREVHAVLAGELPRDQAGPEALRLVHQFEASPWARRLERATRLEREPGFLIALGERLLRGQIDVWFEENGEIVVLDYKTDQLGAADAPARAEEYALQLQLYSLAVERITGATPHRAVVYFLRPGVAVEVSLDPARLEEARRRVEDLFQAQSRVEFPLRVGPHCLRCPHFRGLCPAEYPAAMPRDATLAATLF